MRPQNARIDEARDATLVVVIVLPACIGAAHIVLQSHEWKVPPASDVREIAIAAYGAGEAGYEMMRTGQGRVPTVLVGLGMIVVVPVIALFALAVHGARRLARSARAREAAETARLLRPASAWIDIERPRRSYLKIKGELLRIGRDHENDLQLEDANVHLHHALIQRTPEAEFILLDVSGAKGNGTMVNGRRLARTRLKDGDIIELGSSRVRFHCEPVSRTVRA